MIKRTVLALVAMVMCFPSALQAKVEHLLPKPQEVTVTTGTTFALSGAVSINYADGAGTCALLEEFFTTNGCTLAEGGKAVNVKLVESIEGAYDYQLYGYENEAYTLEITANEITITVETSNIEIKRADFTPKLVFISDLFSLKVIFLF